MFSECLHCEESYSTEDAIRNLTPLGYETTYCSLDCYVLCENMLKAAQLSPKADLVETDAAKAAREAAERLIGIYRINRSTK